MLMSFLFLYFFRMNKTGEKVLNMENTIIEKNKPSLIKKKNDSSLISRMWKSRESYQLILPGAIWYIIFAYIPMYGLLLAFKTYKANLGIFGSPWIGFTNFIYVFRD